MPKTARLCDSTGGTIHSIEFEGDYPACIVLRIDGETLTYFRYQDDEYHCCDHIEATL